MSLEFSLPTVTYAIEVPPFHSLDASGESWFQPLGFPRGREGPRDIASCPAGNAGARLWISRGSDGSCRPKNTNPKAFKKKGEEKSEHTKHSGRPESQD